MGAAVAAAEHGLRSPPAWRRHVPVALLLIGAASLLVGFARPTTSIRVKRQDATVILVLDVSGSMAARDSQPTRLGAARAAALRYVDKLPKGYRMAADHLLRPHDAGDGADARPVADAGGDQPGAQRAPGNRARRRRRARRSRSAAPFRSRRASGRRRWSSCFSDGGQTAGRIYAAAGGAAGCDGAHPGHDRRVGTPDGIVQQPVKGGYTERIQVPVEPAVLQAIAKASGGQFVSGVARRERQVDLL